MCQEPTELRLDWLFDRINLDSKIQIRYIVTKHQLADILTKGNFTHDEWNNLPHLFNISHFSSICCAKNSSLISGAKTMAKRMQEQKGEERSVATSKSAAMNLPSHVRASSFLIRKKSDCIQRSGDTQSYGETWEQDEKEFEIRRSVEFSSEAARCILWRVDGHSHGETCRNKRRIRRCGPFQNGNLELSRRGSLGKTHC